jgi:F0F1-type ATP synthase assembly protein I
MSDHWRVALRYSAWIFAAAVVISGLLLLIYGAAHAWSIFYGAGTAVLSFVSTALTISMFAGRSVAAGVLIGAGSFVVRLAFAAAVLGIPAYLGLWPVVPMLAGFAGVYVAENVAATMRVARTRRNPSAEPGVTGSAREGAGRKVGS